MVVISTGIIEYARNYKTYKYKDGGEYIKSLYVGEKEIKLTGGNLVNISSNAEKANIKVAVADGWQVDKICYSVNHQEAKSIYDDENAELIQLAFCENNNYNLTVETDNGFWLDLGSGEIYCTRNIRPVKASKYIKQEDSATGIYHIPVLCRYPGGLNPRVRWESAEISAPESIASRSISSSVASLAGSTARPITSISPMFSFLMW